MKSSGPFYLAVIERLKSQVWYRRQRMGIQSINSFMKSLAVQGEIEGKRLTNHSAHAGEETQSCQPTSRRNYWRHWPYKGALFSRLRGRRWEWTTADFLNHKLWRSGKNNAVLFRMLAFPLLWKTRWWWVKTTINNFHGCQVTINYQLSQKFPKPRCSVPQAESIADDC